MKKIALVTGAAGGIGSEATLQLVDKGFLVYATDLSLDALSGLPEHEDIARLQLDVTSESSVRAAVNKVIEGVGQIDVLVSNAGYAQLGALECVPIELAQKEFEVNLFGGVRVVQAVLPFMRSRRSGRIIMMSSVVGKISMPGFGWYAGSKHALEAVSDALREEVRPLGIDVSIIEPGRVVTPFIDKQVARLKEVGHPSDYEHVAKAAFNAAPPGGGGASAKLIGKAVADAATSRTPPVRHMLPFFEPRVLTLIRRWGGDWALNKVIRIGMKIPTSI